MDKTKEILLIDDDEDDWILFTEAVKRVDKAIACFYASSGEGALQTLVNLDRKLPDYIFLDLNMPRMSGIDCLIELKERQNLRHIPVVIYTTSNQEKDIVSAKTLGASYFLTKPNGIADLQTAIAYIISEKDRMKNSGNGFVHVLKP